MLSDAVMMCPQGERWRMEGKVGKILFHVIIAVIMVFTGTINTLAAK